VWRVDLRGSGHGLTLAWQPAHAGRSRDLAAVVEAASRRYPQSQIHLVGFSLSGNIVLKMLGERWHETAHQQLDVTRLGSALAVAPPIDLHACADNMDRFSRSIYTRYYLRVLDAQVQLRKSRWPQWHQVPAMPPIKTIRQFDARYTAPLSGFSSTDHYYTEASSKDLLAAIQTPTTLLIDRHDPIVAYPTFAAAKINPRSTQVITTSHGGHMGYFGIDATNRLIRWLEYFVAEHVKAHTGRKSLS
jgi:predicted alpha/beta-fold hydrolase